MSAHIIRYITTMVIVGLAVLTATTFYNTWKEIGQVVPAALSPQNWTVFG
jgi:hypothetical protein